MSRKLSLLSLCCLLLMSGATSVPAGDAAPADAKAKVEPAVTFTPAPTVMCGGCGDGYCVCGETPLSCPDDCGKGKPPVVERMATECEVEAEPAKAEAKKAEPRKE